MKKLTVLLLVTSIFLMAGIAQASSIYVSNYSSDIKVYITKYKGEADLCVYVTNYSGEARDKDYIWYYTKYPGEAKAKICFVNYKSGADLVVYITDYRGEAGWQKSNKYTGRL